MINPWSWDERIVTGEKPYNDKRRKKEMSETPTETITTTTETVVETGDFRDDGDPGDTNDVAADYVSEAMPGFSEEAADEPEISTGA